MLKKTIVFSLLIVLIMLTGCNQRTIKPRIKTLVNSSQYSKYKKIAVLSFTDAPNAPGSGKLIEGLVSQSLGEYGFQVVEKGFFNEKRLTETGLSDEKKLVELGKMLGVKAVVIGNVGQFETTNEGGGTTFVPTFYGPFYTGSMPVNNPTYRVSFVSISLRIIDVETGNVILSGSGQYDVGVTNPPQQTAEHLLSWIMGSWFTGGRIGFEYDKDFIIIKIMPKWPAEKAGLKIGDKILKVNDISVNGIVSNSLENYELWYGKPGESIKLDIDRSGLPMTFNIIRIDPKTMEDN